MEALFRTWETSRGIFNHFIEKYSLEQLNFIPTGFSNNLIWNIGHIIVSQQGLIYRLSGNETIIPTTMTEKYKNGTRPNGNATVEDLDEIKSYLIPLILQTKEDFAKGKFNKYIPYSTQTGFVLNNIEEAFQFNNYHEGLHLGLMMSIRRFISLKE